MPYKGIETTDFACQSVEMTGVFLGRAVYDPILNLVPPFCNPMQCSSEKGSTEKVGW